MLARLAQIVQAATAVSSLACIAIGESASAFLRSAALPSQSPIANASAASAESARGIIHEDLGYGRSGQPRQGRMLSDAVSKAWVGRLGAAGPRNNLGLSDDRRSLR
jgi:hypothetical protein